MKKGLNPIVSSNSRILILGSFPGNESLTKNEYYANKRNQFWRIMSDILNKNDLIYLDYQERLNVILDNGIALWDVIDQCERIGSLDSKIDNSSIVFNDIKKLLTDFVNIKYIYANGNKAKELLLKINIEHEVLPSSSPAHAISYDIKLNAWKSKIKI